MQFRHLVRRKINFAAWDDRVSAEQLGPVYNYSWYLDAATGQQWNAVVGGDYEYLLPLPFNRKLFGLPQVYMPPMTQQLGIGFLDLSKNPKILPTLLHAIPRYYWRVLLQFHAQLNEEQASIFRPRSNLVLPLGQPYEQLRQAYSRSLRRRLRKAEEHYSLLEGTDPDALIELYRQEVGERAGLNNWGYQRIQAIIRSCLERGFGQIKLVVDQDNEVHARAFFAGQDRILNLFGASTPSGREGFAMHFLLDRIIAQHSGKDRLFDFEGSEIPGVRAFFLSFGALEDTYWSYQGGIGKF